MQDVVDKYASQSLRGLSVSAKRGGMQRNEVLYLKL